MDGNFLRKKKKKSNQRHTMRLKISKKQNMETMEPNGVEDSIDS